MAVERLRGLGCRGAALESRSDGTEGSRPLTSLQQGFRVRRWLSGRFARRSAGPRSILPNDRDFRTAQRAASTKQRDPFPATAFYFDLKTGAAKSPDDCWKLLAQNAGDDQHAASAECAVKAGRGRDQQLAEKICRNDLERLREFPAQQVDGEKLRAADFVQPRVRARVCDSAWIVVESEHFLRPETPRGEREDSRSCARVEQAPTPRKFPRRRFEQTQAHRSGRVVACSECTSGRNNELSLLARPCLRHNHQPPADAKRRAHFRLLILLLPITRQPLRCSSEATD